MVLDYLQTMWAQKPVCGLFANNVGSLAAIVGPTSPVFAANVSRQVPLFAGQPADDCGPLQIPLYCTLAKITHRRRFHYRCIGAKSPWVPERRFGTLARRQEGEEQSG